MSEFVDAANPVSLGDMARGYFRGKLLVAAVKLGIADVLGDVEKDLDEIALATKSNPDALYRMMRALASIGIVAEVAPARFCLTQFGQPLRRNVPNSVWGSVIFWADLLADSWTYLADCVQAGSRQGATSARERDGMKSRWSVTPDAQAIFHQAFAESTVASMSPFVAAHDFSKDRVVADLGGGGGGLLAAILTANPHVRGILVDRSQAVSSAATKFQSIGLADRCEFLAGDLLDTIPQGPDTYILQSVLHGYDDNNAHRILKNCRAVTKPSGRLLIIEVVLPTTVASVDPDMEKLLMADINMLAVTGGRERSQAEWSSLLSSARYQVNWIVSVPESTASIIESVPCE